MLKIDGTIKRRTIDELLTVLNRSSCLQSENMPDKNVWFGGRELRSCRGFSFPRIQSRWFNNELYILYIGDKKDIMPKYLYNK